MTATQLLDSIQDAYNKYTKLEEVPYNIAVYLMNNDDFIWRLLKYPVNTAWNANLNANLTNTQKGALIYQGTGMMTDFRVFFDAGMSAAWTEVATVLRISPVTIIPKNYVTGTQSIRFEVYSHETINMLSNKNPRSLSIIQRLIEVLNGAEIENLGRLFFDYKASQYCRMTGINVGNSVYKGFELIMCNQNF
jgi:type II secretory pathway component GspD/PulD (secretin)